MIEISPKEIKRKWDTGFALDFHTISSVYMGDDEYGHPQFDTKRTEIGELLYRLKYGQDRSVLEMIVMTAVHFIKSKAWSADLVIPVPPSRYRRFQPVVAIAERLAEALQTPFCGSCVVKVKDSPELKNIYDYNERTKLLEGAFRVARPEVEAKSVLLLDDLYRSGATMSAVSAALKDMGNVARIHVLALTMSRSKR